VSDEERSFARARRGLPRLTAAAGLLILVALVLVLPRSVRAESCDKDEIKIGIVEATGCFKERKPEGEAPVYDVSSKFRMNGFDVEPSKGAKVIFTPGNDKRSPSVATSNGWVDLSATHPTFGTAHFEKVAFSFAPPKTGDVTIAETALNQPLIAVVGVTPLGVKEPIKLTEEGAEFKLSFDVGGLFGKMLTRSDKTISFGVDFDVANGAYKVAAGKFGVSDFELAHLLTVNEAEVEFGPSLIDISLEAEPTLLRKVGIIGGAKVANGVLNSFTFGLSELNKPLGSSGVFLQKLSASIFTSPPYGAKGVIGLTAGPKTKFFGKDVSAVAIDGSVEIRGDDPGKAVAYFTAGGDIRLLTLPVGNAHFTYHFGQGTDFSANFGIGFPSGTNDPGQPTYVGGGFSGWTTAQHFDLEGHAQLKLLGLSLLGAKTVISDYGFAGCLQLGLWVGGGVRWSDGHGEALGGFTCNIGGYQRQRAATLAAAEDGHARVNLEKGERVVRILAPPGQDAPQVTLENDDGSVMQTPDDADADGIRQFDGGYSLNTDDGMTAFIVDGDAAGEWKLNEMPGSSPVETIETAGALPPANVRARVSGKGRTKTLHWHARRIPHQSLQFSERLPGGREVLIHTARKANGKVHFRPVEGAGTYGVKRKLAVDVMQRRNTPRDELVADTYRVRRQPASPRVRRVRVERRLDDVVVSWKRSRGARRYEVGAKAVGSGAIYQARVGHKRNRVRLTVGTTKRMRIKVVPVNAQQTRGKATVRTIDTHKLVRGNHQAVRRLVRGAHLIGGGRIVANPACPADGNCTGRLVVARHGRTLGTGRFELPPDMTDRLTVRLDGRARRALAHRQVRISGRIEQVDGAASFAQTRSFHGH
jgi:hypothetical protein